MPLECLFQLPIEKDFILSQLYFTIDDVTIKTEIMEKNSAIEKYEDQLTKGHVPILAQKTH